MERKFFINWSFIIEEAKQRRKALKLTQQRLALIANVSTPTISRFENGEKDIQWSSILNILTSLGLVDQHRLDFPHPEPKHYTDEGVEFWGKDGDKKIRCYISEDSLQDQFNSNNENSLKIFKKNQTDIEQRARRKYLYDNTQIENEVIITNNDF